MTTLQKLKEKIGTAKGYEDFQFKQDINYSLADVLLAIQKADKPNGYVVIDNGIISKLVNRKDSNAFYLVTEAHWDLIKDLDAQSTECIDFLSKVLGV